MKTISVRFSLRMKWLFYSVFGVLFLSGIVWLGWNYFYGQEGFDTPYSALGHWLLKIHGAAAMGSLGILGVLIPVHMQRAWAQRRNRLTALVMVIVALLMVGSGYGLYYCGDEKFRLWISSGHSVAGILLPVTLIWHIFAGRQRKVKV